MRLTKTLYIVEEIESDTPIGYDSFGRPVFGTTSVKTPFMGEIEPYSSKLTETRYGIFADVTHRLFCLPNEKIKINAYLEYNNQSFQVTGCLEFDKHYEVLMKQVIS